MTIIQLAQSLRRYLTLILMAFFVLLFTPAQGEMTISGTSNLDTLEYDLDNIHIRLDKLESRWQLSPTDGKLFVDRLNARKLTITMRSAAKKAGDSALPAQIKLPFPVEVQQAEVMEVLIITPTEQHVLNNVQFEIEANNQSIQLKRLSAGTPFGQVDAKLEVETLNPFALSGTFSLQRGSTYSTAGAEHAKSTDSTMPYDVKVNLFGNLNQLQFETALYLTRKNDRISLAQVTAEPKSISAIATIKALGEIGLDGQYPIKLNAQIVDVDPQRLRLSNSNNIAKGRLNIDLDVNGNLAPEGDNKGLQILFAAKDSYLEIKSQRQPVNLVGKMMFQHNVLQDIDLKLNVASNTLIASGNLGMQTSANGLTWRADLPDLSTFGTQFSGEAHASGSVAGTFDQLGFTLELAAQRLKLPNDIKLSKLDGKASLQPGAQGAMNMDYNATGLKVAQNPVLETSFAVKGTRDAHQVIIRAREQNSAQSSPAEKVERLQFDSTLTGGLTNGQWLGSIQSLRYQGETPVNLVAPATLKLSSGNIGLENATLQLAKGRVVVRTLHAGNNGFISQGNIDNLAMEDIPSSLFALPERLQDNPVFSAKWDINAVEAVNGNATFKLESGDIALKPNGVLPNALNTKNDANNAVKPLGLQALNAQLDINQNKLNLNLHIKGQQLGFVEAQVNTVLTKVASGFALMQNAPLKISSNVQLNTLAWLPLPASLADANLDGALNMTLHADGTVQKPDLRGNVTGSNLQFALPSQGVLLTEGTLNAQFEKDEMRISQAGFKGGTGYLRTTGALKMQNNQPKVSLDWVAEQFTVISGIDRLLILNGAGKTNLEEGIFAISGDFKVVRGLLQLPDDNVPTLGDDVVVLGPVETVAEPAQKILLNALRLDLGDDFKLGGRGLDAQLTGAITLNGLTQYHPHAEGTIRVKKGTYVAYGQTLNITRGVISFNGAIDNPGLNIRAMRNAVSDSASLIVTNADTVRNTGEVTGSNFSQTASSTVQNVNAGVEITGNALDPRVKLVSEPNVTDTEKLSWLVLGHGTESAGKSDFAMLSLAAGAVLSQGDSVPLQTKLARAAGLDELGFTGTDAESASLTFGKRLSSQLYLSYVKSVSGLLDVARLTYNLTPRWALQAQTGSESAVDALYTFSFK